MEYYSTRDFLPECNYYYAEEVWWWSKQYEAWFIGIPILMPNFEEEEHFDQWPYWAPKDQIIVPDEEK